MNIPRSIGAVFLKLGTRNVYSQKKENDTYYVVAMATILASVSFCEKPTRCFFFQSERPTDSVGA